MLKLWGYSKSDSCALCKGENCTLHHILANCNVALNQGRFTWRHDSVLLFLESALTEHLANHSKKPKTPQLIKFVGKGDGNKSKSSIDRSSSILDPANDWNLLVDFTTKRMSSPPKSSLHHPAPTSLCSPLLSRRSSLSNLLALRKRAVMQLLCEKWDVTNRF